MPASSETARDRYVHSVAESDFVIWLVDEETTQPILDEVHTCINTEGRLLAFILPNKACDAQTQSLIQAAEEYATWHEVEDIDDLYENVRATLSDEINRLIRNPVPRGREQKLRELRRESIARCEEYFITLGVPNSVAEEMAACREVGYSPSLPESGVVKIVGAQGVGKTLTAERIFQGAIDNAIGDNSQPFPIFVRARNLGNRLLTEIVEDAAGNYADLSAQGALVIIDGLDEVGVTSANGILDDAAVYARANPKAVVVVTTRPISGLKDVEHDITVPQLTDSEALILISKVAERGFDKMYLFRLAEPLRDVARLPLFAIMIGSELGNNSNFTYPTQTHLVAQVARGALQRMDDRTEDMEDLLQRLAVEVIQNKGGVAKSEVDRRAAIHTKLLNTRLVAEENNKIDFTLSVFREWFGARALVERGLSLDQLKPELEQWIIPITIAIRSEDEIISLSMMSELVSINPGIASRVLNELERNSTFTGTKNPPMDKTTQEVGLEIRKAMEGWGVGLGSELMQEIGPVKQNGELCPLDISLNSNWASISWYIGSKNLDSIVEAPDFDRHVSGQYIDPGWRSLLQTAVYPTRFWPWTLTKSMLTDSLKQVLESRRLTLTSVDTVRELSYEFASDFIGATSRLRSVNPKSIDIREVLSFIDSIPPGRSCVLINGFTYNGMEMQAVSSDLSRMLKNGEPFVSDPWPGPDKDSPTGKTSWQRSEEYTDGRLLERVSAIYEAALRIYTGMTETYFTNLGTGSNKRYVVQARLEGMLIIPPRYESYRDGPILTWWPRPINKPEQSKTDFQLEYRDDGTHDRIRRMIEIARIENFEHSGTFWHSSTMNLRIHERMPATELAHEWLKNDLRDIGWKG